MKKLAIALTTAVAALWAAPSKAQDEPLKCISISSTRNMAECVHALSLRDSDNEFLRHLVIEYRFIYDIPACGEVWKELFIRLLADASMKIDGNPQLYRIIRARCQVEYKETK